MNGNGGTEQDNGERGRLGALWYELWRLRWELLVSACVIVVLDSGWLQLDPRSFTALALNASGKSGLGGALGLSSWQAVHHYWHTKGAIAEAQTQAQAMIVAAMQRSKSMWVGAWIIGMNLVP